MEDFDVAVIGAGPAGCMAARCAARHGARTVIMEEHRAAGWPVQCAGLLGIGAIEQSGLSPGRYMISVVHGASVYAPSGDMFSFQSAQPRAWVVDRRLFDRAMAVEAVSCGSHLLLGCHVSRIDRIDGWSVVSCKLDGVAKRIRSRVVISAEGVGARLARMAGVPPAGRILSGAQVEAPFKVEDCRCVELHLGVAPGLFAWVIPTGQDRARIGLCADKCGGRYLSSFLRSNLIKRRLLGSPIDLVVGGLPIGPPKRTVAEGMIAVGDAAAQVKPTSGGGIYPGLVAAKIAGFVASAAALERDGTVGRLLEYDRRWRREIGRELEIGMRFHNAMFSMRDCDLDEIVICLAKRPELLSIVEKHGDIDRPSTLFAKMLPHLGIEGFRVARILAGALMGLQ